MKRKIRILSALMTIVMIALCFLATQAKAEDSITIDVLIPKGNNYGYCYEKNGKYAGYYIDYLKEIAKYTGWKYNYIIAEDNEELIEHMEKGDYDIMPGIVYSEEYDEAYFDYPLTSIGARKYAIVTLKSNSKIIADDYSTLIGCKVAVTTNPNGKELEIRFKNFLDRNGIDYKDDYTEDYTSGINFIHMEGNKRLESMESGETDAILTSDSVALENDYSIAAVFGSDSLYIVTPNGKNKYISELEQTLSKITRIDTTFESRLFQKYFSSIYERKLEFSMQESEYLEKNRVLKVAMLSNQAPYSYMNDKDELSGINICVFDKISKNTGGMITFKYNIYDTQEEAIQAVYDGDCDIYGLGVYSSDISERENRFINSPYYFSDDIRLYRNINPELS